MLVRRCGLEEGITLLHQQRRAGRGAALWTLLACVLLATPGEMKSCNWPGIWYLVGGAGKERRAEGVRYLKHACDEGYSPACKLIEALRRRARQAG